MKLITTRYIRESESLFILQCKILKYLWKSTIEESDNPDYIDQIEKYFTSVHCGSVANFWHAP